MPATQIQVRPVPTLLGAGGGLVVGLTTVGSGSLIIVILLAMYPELRADDLVGTDLVQAVPLVMSALAGISPPTETEPITVRTPAGRTGLTGASGYRPIVR